MAIITQVDSAAENVCAADDTQVIQHLWRGNPTRRSRRIKVRHVEAGKEKGRYVGPRGISLALSEQESETRITGRELINYTWRDHPTVAQRQVRGAAEHFTKRRAGGIELRPAIQRIPF